ncbi:MAG TPA: glucose-6-phosphate isomerase family protein [Candidatus Paceibacterota bacterium]|mgnify:CR=1 FL=1|nr:glucose-6-phosphate isomerase family protein [Candidatus Paceibacterota bacterium]HPT40074.1 glucose-6-phosphate isomerase family protein [Candidatus Paceibacterota bacterium]
MKQESKRISDLKPVLYDDGVIGDAVVYDVERGKDAQNGWRQDLTVIYPQMLGREIPKTFGHYHKNNEVEIYEILSGKIGFLCQKHSVGLPLEIEQVYLIEANKGEKIVIPSEFSMTSINLGETEASMFNWVNDKIENDYSLFIQNHGACYYIVRKEDGAWEAIKNNRYQKVPELIKLKPRILPKELENLEFLTNQLKYKDFLTVDKLFEKIN